MTAKRRKNELDELLQDAVSFMDWPSNAGPTNARIMLPDTFDIHADLLEYDNHSEPSTSTSELRQREPAKVKKQRKEPKPEKPKPLVEVVKTVKAPIPVKKPLFCQKPAERKPQPRPARLNLLSIVEETAFVPCNIPPPLSVASSESASETESVTESEDEVIVIDDDPIESDQSATFYQVLHPLMLATGTFSKAPLNSSKGFLHSRRFIIGAPSANLSV